MDPNDLYGLPLERFTAERNALAKALRAEGRRDDAARVTAMRKPSVAAWAVNQLVCTQRREFANVLKAGDALQQAQSELVAGRGDSSTLRKASERERAVVDQLAQKAQGLLSAEGRELTRATLDRVAETLHAAALDEDARAQVADACLGEELRHVGLGADGAIGGAAAPTRPRGRNRAAAAAKAASRPDAAERKRAERLQAARKSEAEARRELERASRELENAERRRDRADESLQEAEASVSEARQRAKQAARTHQRAQRALES